MNADGERGVSAVTEHPFTPRGEWWTVCRECGLAEAAHTKTTLRRDDDGPNPSDGRKRERIEALRRTMPQSQSEVAASLPLRMWRALARHRTNGRYSAP